MYAPLRTHSWHSLLTGIDPPEGLLARAARLGLSSLALTDVDTLASTVEFLKAAEHPGAPRPILGAEISDPSGQPGRVIALVRDAAGYANLCKLTSARQLGDDPGALDPVLEPEHFDLVEAVLRFRTGLIFLVDHPRLVIALSERLDREQLFLAISPASLSKKRGTTERVGVIEAPKVPPPGRAVPIAALIECAQESGLATLAVPDVYWARRGGFEHHRMRTAIKHNALRCDLPSNWLAERPAHLMAPEELGAFYAPLPDCPGPLAPGKGSIPGALSRTLEVAEQCHFLPALGEVLFPEVELGESETAYSRLCLLAFDGAQKRFIPLRPEVVRRLDFELSTIDGLGFAPYFLLVKRIADFACSKNIPCVGRGSAADSLVAYCLKLTDADPLRYRLPFERFLNPARKDRPDIDLDFCWRRRDEVIEHVWEAFGPERTAMIATWNRFGLRSAFREAALAEGLPPVEVNRWSRRLPFGIGSQADSFDGTAGSEDEAAAEEEMPPAHNPIARAFAATPECRDFPVDDPRYGFVLDVAAALLDAPRHLGLHPGGVVVSPGPITNVLACQHAAKGVLMTQIEKDGVEALGLVKMDLLGNRALTVIDDCLRSLGDRAPDLEHIAEDDSKTKDLLVRGRTLGCFQVESPGMRSLLQQTAARTMDDVIQAVALIRPGPSGAGMKDAYVRRSRGLESPRAPHPRLEELLFETHGILLYQEDVMQSVVLIAGFDLAGADQLRCALSKRRSNELEKLRKRYFHGCEQNGIARKDADHLWKLVSNFSSFGFCKAHAVTYGRISYRTIYLKAHHPAAFLVAFLNSDTGYYETRVYIEEARRLGIAILPPDVNRSAGEFSLEEGAIRVGLERVRGLTENTSASIFRARELDGPFLSLPDFLARTQARVDETERLILSGVFDAFDRTRPEMLWRLHLLTTPKRRPPSDLERFAPLDRGLLDACKTTPDQRARESTGGWSQGGLGVSGIDLAGGESATLFPDPPTPSLALPPRPELDPEHRGRLELELLGLTTALHPTELFPCTGKERARGAPPPVPCGEIDRHREKHISVCGWLAASRRVRTNDGRWMRFLTLEDPSGITEVVCFPDIYERDGHRLSAGSGGKGGPFLISGRVEDRMGSFAVHAERIW
ncbi:MAG: hypothetical protein CMJ89_16230 [Planctomycetes bacterium]|jgi:DNA-directed DNA polymerase III PolC|nr:hypothetical protein [Planctomycetota bacterium]